MANFIQSFGVHFSGPSLNWIKRQDNRSFYNIQECIPVGCVPSAELAVSGGGGGGEERVFAGWCLSRRGVSAWGGVICLGGVCLGGVHPVQTQRQTPHQTQRETLPRLRGIHPHCGQTPVKTLPFRNYCCGRWILHRNCYYVFGILRSEENGDALSVFVVITTYYDDSVRVT